MLLYLAGPEVFLPDGAAVCSRKAAICLRHGLRACTPLDTRIDLSAPDAALRIYRQNRALMLGSDAIIANLTPFRGPSADDGTAFELGFFDALGRPAFAYSNVCGGLAERTRAFLAGAPDGFAVEEFGLACNLMLPHAALARGGLAMLVPDDGIDRPLGDLGVFETLVARVAAAVTSAPGPHTTAAGSGTTARSPRPPSA